MNAQTQIRWIPLAVAVFGLSLATAGCGHLPRASGESSPPAVPVRLARAPQTQAEMALPATCWTEIRDAPEALAMHVLRIDLRCPSFEVIAMPAADPDGDGPAEAALTDPRELALRFQALAAVNANGFALLPDASPREENRWRRDLPVDIFGIVVHAGKFHSGPSRQADNNLCFWLDRKGRPFFGPYPGVAAGMREGVNAWYNDLVAGGQVLQRPGGVRHPRTAVGTDEQGRWLYLAVIDGRQPGYSVGMTPHELAVTMARLGCWRAVNLDGGGSSILLAAASAGGALDVINRPSDGSPRPVPVLLGIRRR